MSWRARFEAHLAAALSGRGDPAVALARAADDDDLPPGLRRALASVDANGVRMSALLVAELRFERLMNGSRVADEWFAREPEAFTHAFHAYHREVPPTATHPGAEAEAFERWLAARG